MNDIICDFIDVMGIREEKTNAYITLRLENPLTGNKYFFRIAKDLFDFAWENRDKIETPITLTQDDSVDIDKTGYVS